jgi:hypothetical protein
MHHYSSCSAPDSINALGIDSLAAGADLGGLAWFHIKFFVSVDAYCNVRASAQANPQAT